MAAILTPEGARHVGWAVCEHARLVVPIASTFAKRADAAGHVYDDVLAATGCVMTDWQLFPVSEVEMVWEMLEELASDSGTTDDPYSVGGLVVIAPWSARAAASEERDAAIERALRDAGAFVALLGSMGYPAAYSRGANVGCNAPEDDPRPASLGMRWSGKRGQWWARVEKAGDQFATRYTHRDEIAAMAA